jgi:alkanesulfonate monooxygenase SsuD/methylene tetrahydromethanopterin reductase-like flavin-dependent oxidoreductase (luciferase family)
MQGSGAPVAALIMSTTPPAQIAGLARQVERLGFGELWIPEDYFFLGGFAGAAIALASTERIQVGTGIVSALVRHPAVTAQEIATIAGAFPGRFLPGIGLGVPGWMQQMALLPPSPLTAIRECVTSVKRLLAGEEVSQEGRQYAFHGVRLTHPPAEPPPIMTGAMQPKALELSGEIADGNVIGAMAPLEYVGWSLERMRAGAERAGRGGYVARAPLFAIYNCRASREQAKAEVRPVLAFYLAVWPRNVFTEMAGVADDLEALVAKGGAEAVAAEMPDDWVDTFTLSGDPDECAERVKAFVAAGAASVVLAPYDGAQSEELFDIAAREIVPRL